jgi:kinesin family protein 1
LHEATFLNQITAAGHQVQLTLIWEVETDKSDKPLQFSTDLFVQIQGRDASNPSKFRTLITPTRTSTKITSIYLVHLRPPLTRHIDDLWRTSTANGYVRGEEFLGNWKPRGISIVREYQITSNRLQNMKEVVATRQMLYLRGDTDENEHSTRMATHKAEMARGLHGVIPKSHVNLITHIISIWKSACVHYSGVST